MNNMKFKSYPKYKDSRVQWIGKIPEEWEVNKLKHSVYALEKSGLEASEGEHEGIYPFYTSSQIQRKFIEKATFNNECLIMGTGGFASVHYFNGKFSVSNDCLVLRKQKVINMKFLYYQVLNNLQVIDDLGFWGTGLRHLQKYFFYSMLAYWPNKPEQIAIAKFLDKKTTEIDELIEKDKKLIELLKEKRTALINYAVTKGLDPNVKMKESGIEWIGKIPEGWEVHKIKYNIYEKKVKNIAKNPSTKFIGLENIESETGNLISFSTLEDIDGESIKFRENNVLFCKLRPYLAKVIKVDFRGSCTGELAVYEVGGEINSQFLFYRLLSKSFIDLINSATYGVKMPRVNSTQLNDIKIAWPSLSEQTAIAKYLDKETAKIDKTIQKIEQKIALLEEYKKSLIHHVVTGKIDVRGSEI